MALRSPASASPKRAGFSCPRRWSDFTECRGASVVWWRLVGEEACRSPPCDLSLCGAECESDFVARRFWPHRQSTRRACWTNADRCESRVDEGPLPSPRRRGESVEQLADFKIRKGTAATHGAEKFQSNLLPGLRSARAKAPANSLRSPGPCEGRATFPDKGCIRNSRRPLPF